MTALKWDQAGERVYESGLSRGVLYLDDNRGVAWNGLTAIEEANTDEVLAVFYDGVKISDVVSVGEYSAILRAFTYPDEFLEYEGTFEDDDGVFITNQQPKRFGLAYRTNVSNDLDETAGYKLHVVYNLTAQPAERNYSTLRLDEAGAMEFEWSITAIPEELAVFRPTAHIVFDSRKMDEFLLRDVEEILYGNEITDPYLPSMSALLQFIQKWNRLIIIDNGDGTWTATSEFPDIIVEVVPDDTYTIDDSTVVVIDANSYTITSSEKNLEDIV